VCVVHATHSTLKVPDNGRRYHPKHVEQFPDKINCVMLHLVGYILEYYLWRVCAYVAVNVAYERTDFHSYKNKIFDVLVYI
jgi:hypothetical protein